MKPIIASLALLLCATAHAETLTPESCGTGETAVCQTPAPDISVLTYQYVYGDLTLVIDGVTYTGVAPRGATSYSGTVYARNGAIKTVNLVFELKAVHASPRTTVLHWTLTSGSVE